MKPVEYDFPRIRLSGLQRRFEICFTQGCGPNASHNDRVVANRVNDLPAPEN